MRALIVALALLIAGPALAESVDRADWLDLQLAESQAREASLRLDLARVRLVTKYRVSDGDSVDPKTLEIRRAPLPPAKPRAKP